MAFRGSTWQQIDKVYSLTAELNSNFGNGMYNKLIASFTFSDINNRKCDADFPTIDIYKPYDGMDYPYMYAGYDQYAYNNGIKDRTWNFADDFSLSLGKHNLTAGLALSMTNASNCFMRYGAGYYRYASLDDFENGAAPTAFALCYSCYSLTGKKMALSDVRYNKLSVYVQDKYLVNGRLSLRYGVRMDLPWYANHRYDNPSIADIDFNGIRLNTGHWPKALPVFSPRIGFSYDTFGDGRLVVRGGIGFFAGRFPLIYLSKMQEGTGMLQATAMLNAMLKSRPFPWFDFMMAYTYAISRALNNNASNYEEKALAGLPTIDGLNHQTMGGMRGQISPGRLIAMTTFSKEYNRHNAILVSLFYEGQHGGNGTFMYANDLNNDGYNNDRLYIPATRDELLFSDKTV